MSQPMAVLGRVEEEVSALLVAGLATRRGGRERLEDLATDAYTLKIERLAQELRVLAQGQEPAALANSAFTALAMARKLRERLIPWPEVAVENLVSLSVDSPLRVSLPEPLADNPDPATLACWMESGNDLVRSHAADLLVACGEEGIPELARVASTAPTAVRRAAIRALGRIGGDAALATLLGLPDIGPCWRALLEAVLPYGHKAVPSLVAILEAKPEKKHQEKRRAAAALLYRLGANEALIAVTDREGDALEMAFGFAARARTGSGWEKRLGKISSVNWDKTFYGKALATLALAEESDETGELVQVLDEGAVDDLKMVGRWAVTGSPIEGVLAERSLERTDGGNAKSRQRATSFLCGLAYPPLVPLLMARLARNEVEVVQAINILGETGGSQAIGLLLDMLRQDITVLGTLGQVGDPAAAPALLKLLERSIAQGAEAPMGLDPGSIEHTIASLGDGIADLLGQEMRARQGTPTAESIKRTLLQMKGKGARNALKGIDIESVESLVSRLGHANVSKDAIKALIRKGDEAVETVETVAAQGDHLAANDALAALDGIGSARAIKAMQNVLEQRLPRLTTQWDSEARLCIEAVNLVSKRQNVAAIPLLVRTLSANCGAVRNAAVDALVRIGLEVVPQSMSLLDSPLPGTRASALMVAARLRVVAAEGKALDLLADADQQVRNSAATALGEICKVTCNPKIAEALGKALLAGTLSTPFLGIQALGQTGQRSAIPYLRKFLDTNPGHSYFVDQAIKKIEATSPAGVSGLAGKLKGLFGGGR